MRHAITFGRMHPRLRADAAEADVAAWEEAGVDRLIVTHRPIPPDPSRRADSAGRDPVRATSSR